jgi:hypothetical protein
MINDGAIGKERAFLTQQKKTKRQKKKKRSEKTTPERLNG